MTSTPEDVGRSVRAAKMRAVIGALVFIFQFFFAIEVTHHSVGVAVAFALGSVTLYWILSVLLGRWVNRAR